MGRPRRLQSGVMTSSTRAHHRSGWSHAAGRPAHTRLGQHRDRVAVRRGRNIGVVAAARELLGLVFYGLRDHHIRALDNPAPPPAAGRSAA